MQKIREETLVIHITDPEKAWPILKEMHMKPEGSKEKYGFSITTLATGNITHESEVFERALEKVYQDDLEIEDMFDGTSKRDLDGRRQYYDDLHDMLDDAKKQAKFQRDCINNGCGVQTKFNLVFKKGKKK